MSRAADVLARGLAAHGVDHVFALSGNQIMPLFDALFDTDIRLIHTRHEAGAVFMAEGYAQIAGRLGVALVTAGGGLGNTPGALLAARASDTPLLLLSGDSPVSGDGRGAFQEMDQVGVTGALTKGSRRVMRADEMAEALDWAVSLALRDRPGPVHLALPADVLTGSAAVVSHDRHDDSATRETAPAKRLPDSLRAFDSATRPLILMGPALTRTRAPGLADRLSERFDAPVLDLDSPRGLNDPSLGRLSRVFARADAVLMLGKTVDFTVGFGAVAQWPETSQWHVILGDGADLAAARRNLGDRLTTGLVGDPAEFAERLCKTPGTSITRPAWHAEVQDLIEARLPDAGGPGISPHALCAAVQRRIDAAAAPILICDGGEIGQWAQALLTAPSRIINGVSGLIGGGLCYALGAAAARPAAQVLAVMGDGTAGFHQSEFETAAREGLPFVAVIGNDSRWNAEHHIQIRDFGADRAFGCTLSPARYDLAARALGGFGAHVEDSAQLDDALTEAMASGRPACVNVRLAGRPAPTWQH